ncbi:MAG: hypothetical protein WCJ61_04780 [Paludibacter sp.]
MTKEDLIIAIEEAISKQTPVHIYRKINDAKTLWYSCFRIDSTTEDFSAIEGVEFEQRSLKKPMITPLSTATIFEIELLS